MLKTFTASAAAALTSLVFVASPAGALVVRAWVSGHGSDIATCGAPVSPCRTLQYAFTNIVSAGGEIDILDPAGYGAVAINHAISIVNDGVGTAGVQIASGDAITIDAGAQDEVRLKGLNVEGLHTGSHGIVFFGAGTLMIEDCTVRDFTDNAVEFTPTDFSQLQMVNTRLARSGGAGLFIRPSISSGSGTVLAMLSHVDALNDRVGIDVDGSGLGVNGKIRTTVSDSVASGNANSGIVATSTGPSAFVAVRNTSVANNGTGVAATGTSATVYLDRSTISGNNTAFASSSGGLLGSYGNNSIDGNLADGATPFAETLR